MVADKLKNAQPLSSIYIPGNPGTQCRQRWRLTGVLDANGNRVKLECHKIGGRVYTTPEAVDRFIVALSNDAGDDDPRESETDIARRNRETREALRAVGV